MIKILFIHNTAMWYRRPFFKGLSEIYNINFVFTHMQVCKDIYGVEISDEIEGLEGVNYKILKNYFGVAFGAIKEAMGDYDILVGGSWDSLAEIIETSCYFTIAKLRRKPFIIHREDWNWKGKSLKRKLISPFVKFIIRYSDAILVPGIRHKDYFISLGASLDKVFIMPNVSNISVKEEDYINKEKLKEELNIGTKKIILYVGRLVKQKGVEYLINAFANLKRGRGDIVLIILGGGEQMGELESLSKNLNIENSVYFIGYIENELLPPYYLLCNLCVMPSITYNSQADAWGFIVNEAMYFGKPIVATDAVGAAFYMINEGENGFIVPEKNSDSIYEAMKKILFDPYLEKKMGDESRRIIKERFTYRHMVDGFREAIKAVLKKERI